MGIKVTIPAEKAYTPPPEGFQQAVCCDVIDKGIVQKEYKGEISYRHEVQVKFQTKARDEYGKRYTISAYFGMTLHENGNLRPFLQQWQGRSFSDEEIKRYTVEGIDLEAFALGRNAEIQVLYKPKQSGGKKAVITSIAPWRTVLGEEIEVEDYVRVVDRDDYQPPPQTREEAAKFAAAKAKRAAAALAAKADDDIPF